MIALRMVIETNTVVSAALKPDGLQRTVLVLAITKPARLYVSDVIMDEYREVLAREKMNIRKGHRQQLIQLIKRHSHTVTPVRPLHLPPDPDDNKFLECRDAVRADYLVTGNQRHFPNFIRKRRGVLLAEIRTAFGSRWPGTPHLRTGLGEATDRSSSFSPAREGGGRDRNTT
jgi:putative PIN family toxin of toxin-antitoxin system